MPFIESIGVGIANQVLGSLWKRCCGLFDDFRRSKRVAALEAEVVTLTGQLTTANAEVIRLKAVEAEQLTFSNRKKKPISAQKEKIRAPQAELAKRVAFEDKAKNYVRIETEMGSFVYVEKAPRDGDAGTPYICPNCFSKEKISILQPIGGGRVECPACGKTLTINRPRIDNANRPRVITKAPRR